MIAAALAGPVAADDDVLDDIAEAVVEAINVERERRGLRKLKEDGKLRDAAADHVRDMFRRRYFDHVAPDRTRPDDRVRRRGYEFSAVGENLAAGQRTARQAVAGWMRSRRHRETLLGRFEDVGVAVAGGSPVRRRAGGYTFVALFARER
jgi:uncharacterized protein YkwD